MVNRAFEKKRKKRLTTSNVRTDAGKGIRPNPVKRVCLARVFKVMSSTAKVREVDAVAFPAGAQDHVTRGDILMKDLPRVHEAKATDQLVCNHENRLQAEPIADVSEEILEGGTEELDGHHSVVALFAIPVHFWHAHASHKSLVDVQLYPEGRRINILKLWLQFDRDGLGFLEVGRYSVGRLTGFNRMD